MSSTDRSTVETRIVQLQDYLQKLLSTPSIFNAQMIRSTQRIVDFLDHDGTLAIQMKCFALESKVRPSDGWSEATAKALYRLPI